MPTPGAYIVNVSNAYKNQYNKISKTLFLQIFGHATFITQKVRWHSTSYMISIFHLQRLQRKVFKPL